MNVLICKNTETEGPGTIADFLSSREMPFTVVELSKGDRMPDTEPYDTLVMLGGPMSANEPHLYPYIAWEEAVVRSFIRDGKRVLGVCLGSQIMAKALGARVYRGKAPEVGWHDIGIVGDGSGDAVIRSLAYDPRTGEFRDRFKVFHWHGETFDIPEGAHWLALSDLYPHQAFRFGANAYAFQFHIEVTRDIVYDWLRNEPVDFEGIQAETEKNIDICTARAHNFYRAFFLAEYS
jgi:GMP synthase-like glutamine amidotransferase